MADRQLENKATLDGLYDGAPFETVETELITVLMAEITITKAAEPLIWFQGKLTMAITVANEGAAALTDVVVTDVLDITKFALDETSITLEVAGVPVTPVDHTYDKVTGKLTVRIPAIAATKDAVITFQGAKVAVP